MDSKKMERRFVMSKIKFMIDEEKSSRIIFLIKQIINITIATKAKSLKILR